MMKFFRKHNKKLLAIFMVLLMIVFIGGSALESLMSPSFNQLLAQSNLGPVTSLDRQIADGTTSLLSWMGIDWQRPMGRGDESLELVDWILLTREAERLGLGSNTARVQSTWTDMTFLEERSRAYRVKPIQIIQALAEWEAIQRTARMASRVTTPSEADIQASAQKMLEKVRINAVLLPAKMFVDEALSVTDEEIADQFSRYRQREAGAGLQFGYWVHPSMKVQYIKIDRGAIAQAIRVANLEKKAKTYYDERRTREPAFRRSAADIAAVEASMEGPQPTPYLSWDEAKESAKDVIRRQEAKEMASRMGDWFVQYAAEPWLDVERGQDGYKVAPAKVAKLEYYEAIVQNIPSTISYREAVSVKTTDFFSEEEAGDVPELGAATFRAEGSFSLLTLGTLAFRTQVFIPQVPDERGTNFSDYLAPFQTCRYPLTDADGNIYVFHVVEAREGRVPESVDDVRSKVVTDLRLLNGFEVAKARAEALRSCGPDITLQEAYDNDEDLVRRKDTETGAGSGYYELPPLARVSRVEASAGRTRSIVPVGGGITYLPYEVLEECFALAEADDPTKVIELKDRAAVLVVRWMETQRATIHDFEDLRETFIAQLTRYRATDVLSEWFKVDNIRARNGFKLATN